MIKAKFKWDLKQNSKEISEQVVSEMKITSIVQKILESKNIIEKEDIEAVLQKSTIHHDPYEMSDMKKAIDRINTAIDNQERILVYGDYDADGVTSTSILVSTLQELGAEVGWYIPNRFTEGYGPNEAAFKNAYDEGVNLIITVDNGIQGHKEIKAAQELGMDVILTDHHEIGETLPEAFAIVHPMHPEFDYPFKYLSGAGVALKIAQALLDHPSSYYTVLAAIGTVADLVSLTDENRAIVQSGLDILNQTEFPSIQALLNNAGYKDTITEETIGFVIGPRLNAVGRLDDASLAAELLMSENPEDAEFLAEQVEHFNQERKDIVKEISDEALLMAAKQVEKGNQFLVLAQENWHEGVLGIAASKVVETYGLPTIILNIDTAQNFAKGSARSIEQVSMYDILDKERELISKFGGHHMAAGMTLPIENIEQLSEALNRHMFEISRTEDISPHKTVDLVLDENDITVKNIRDIQKLRPFGTDFTSPLFQLNDIKILQAKGIGQEGKHLKMTLGNSKLQSLYWQHGDYASQIEPNQPINMIGTLQINEWNGNQSPQFMVQDMASETLQILDFRGKARQQLKPHDNIPVAEIVNKKTEKEHEHQYFYGDIIENEYERYIFKELPLTITAMENTLASIPQSQIILELNHRNSIYFDGMPDLNKFKKCYKALLSKNNVNLKQDGMQLCEYLNVKPNVLIFMLKVFNELDFIEDNNGIITVNKDVEKKEITSSRLYQARMNRIDVEKFLLYDDFSKVKLWIKDQLAK
ncbi:single-stranded-DNA-specific exonuclease RecJ [Staphylococcus debuckii]|uniref:single-stranded-DNA-specific exonuclease RecJ n=1 Tax=Staphylococcus debuckii TaxID=2044912 RepID=UPI000F436A9D|nr:single-stranded-DNA-specific exonuclease RecJ [Staphylococcus debuckii]AYU55411.1 single-stranded-DNA-specific exonuclease RecJ [Staphylococcus debuckii]